MMAAGAIAATNHHGSRRRWKASRSDYERGSWNNSDEGPNSAWLCIFTVVGTILVSVGGWYGWSSFSDPRATNVAIYNQWVDNWVAPGTGGRAAIERTTFSYRVVSPLATTKACPCQDACGADAACKEACEPCSPVTMEEVDPRGERAQAVAWSEFAKASDDSAGGGLHHLSALNAANNASDIKTYDPLVLEMDHIFPAEPVGTWDGGKWTGAKWVLEVKAEEAGKPPLQFLLNDRAGDKPGVALLKEIPTHANSKMCRLHHNNNMHDHQCWDRVAANKVCMLLNHSAEDSWQQATGANGADGQFGCRVTVGNFPDAEVTYSTYCPDSPARLSPAYTQSCDFSRLQFVVRSGTDPYVLVRQFTKGTMDLGSTPAQTWWQGVIMVTVGCLLLCPGVALSVNSLLEARRMRAAQNRSAHQFHDVAAGAQRVSMDTATSDEEVGFYDRSKGGPHAPPP
eukprot:CAMPEP_0173434684 /NCGR_PEP_ID=MMETSP1357-20121228/13179_1 /TAXON_ID=77926 /ORGANISM="Hemiselmis rufescens, Strain PCC563" /LENGTH=454 /DNA_ID=CAMNT_0014399567 /DNA_START=95 /DNA_END=1456 /DNA_ORIENTATION=-